jgi:hypothetical protein
MKKIFLVSLTAVIAVGLIVIIQEFYSSAKEKVYQYSPTDYIEPEERFLVCTNNTNSNSTADECFKFKASACPAEMGGIEMCINKNFIQEYNSVIERGAGEHWDLSCPEINMVTDRACDCIDNVCTLV